MLKWSQRRVREEEEKSLLSYSASADSQWTPKLARSQMFASDRVYHYLRERVEHVCVCAEGIMVGLWYPPIHANTWGKTSRVRKKQRVCPRLPKYPSSWLPSVFLCDCRSLCWSSAGPSHVGSEAIRVRWRRINTFISTSLSLSLPLSLSHLLPPPPQRNASPSSVLDISEHSVQRDSAMWSHHSTQRRAPLMSISVHCVLRFVSCFSPLGLSLVH